MKSSLETSSSFLLQEEQNPSPHTFFEEKHGSSTGGLFVNLMLYFYAITL